MKRIVLILCFIVMAFSAKAQDLIVKKDGSEIKAKIIAVTESKIEYKRFNYQDGPTFSVALRDVESVTYANGETEQFVNTQAKQIEDKGIALGMAYKDYKKLYDPHLYVRDRLYDPYSPAGSGVASFFIPGLGQMINGQAGKGVGMLLGTVALMTSGSLIMGPGMRTSSGHYAPTVGAYAAALLCYSGALAIDIWAICDAVKVAKIKNMYAQDCRKLQANTFDIKLMPDLAFAQTATGYQPTAGLKLAIQF